ncbi:MAG TPA: methyltransferase [Ktedonobacterales bacterium]|jgi:hypothetical protein|nr:methyltransferase [Ktedonobacterales bacterium]
MIGTTRAVKILQTCKRAVQDSGKVLLVESAIVLGYCEALPTRHLDLEMLLSHGGRQRTEVAYGALFGAAGLQPSAAVPIGDAAQFSVFEGIPA